MDLSKIAADLKAHFESVEQTAQAFLAEHVPTVVKAAELLGSDPLVQVALDDTVPASLRAIGAEFLRKLAAEFPAPAPAPGPAPEVPTVEPVAGGQ